MLDKDRFLENISRYCSSDDVLLIGVSGGVDSMVLYDLCWRNSIPVAVAHCNFSLRGADSDADTELVERIAGQRGTTFYKIVFDTRGEMSRSGLSMQECARKLRYDWFETLSKEHGYTRVAIAHNSDDTVETVFVNLVRGTGVRGLTGIPETNGKIIRPLMDFSREEILDYACRYGVEYREDSSNRNVKYLRNRIRHNVLPQLRACGKRFDGVMRSNMEHFAEAVRFIDQTTTAVEQQVLAVGEQGQATISLRRLAAIPGWEYLLAEILLKYGFRRDVSRQVARAFENEESGKYFYSADFAALLDRDNLELTPRSLSRLQAVEPLVFAKGTPVVMFAQQRVVFWIIEPAAAVLREGSDTAFFDYDTLPDTLCLRSWEEGDAFIPFGMKGSKKVSDFFIDCKVSASQKKTIPLLVAGGEIIWIAGMRAADKYRVGEHTKRLLKCVLEK